jgi:hypothetical protein
MTTSADLPVVSATMDDVLAKFDIVNVVNEPGLKPFIVATPKQLSSVAENTVSTGGANFGELGTSSPSPFTSWIRSEYNRDLLGVRGLQKYDQMRRSDGTVRGTLRLVKTPVLSARWFMEPASTKPKDQKIADFVWCCFQEYMSISWSQFLIESLLMADFGYYMFEKVFEPRIIKGQYRIVWKKLAPRHPMDVKKWDYDAGGGPNAVRMYSDNPTLGDDIIIPIGKLVAFTFDKEAGNIEGIPLLRASYKHWYYKEQLYKIDAIQKERHSIGIPVITLPPGFSESDRKLADELGRNLRTNERAHIVLPPNWEISMIKLEGHPVSSLTSIEHHDLQIEKSILASFLSASVGASKDVDFDLFLKAIRFIADIVANSLNDFAIKQLVDFNFKVQDDQYPKLKARRIGESADWRTLSFAIRNFVGADIIRPDDALEANIRDEMDLPVADVATARVVLAPQLPEGAGEETNAASTGAAAAGSGPATPAKAGATAGGGTAGQARQAPAGAKPPAKNAGTDRSGAK